AAFLPGYAIFADKALLAADLREVALQAVVQGVLIGAVSILVYTRAVAVLGAAETALYTATVPGITTAAAIPLLGEHPSGGTMAGGGGGAQGMLVARVRRGGGAGGVEVRSGAPASHSRAPAVPVHPARAADKFGGGRASSSPSSSRRTSPTPASSVSWGGPSSSRAASRRRSRGSSRR